MDASEHIVNNREKIDSLFNDRKDFTQWLKDHQMEICLTVVIHLFVFLILAVNQIRTLSSRGMFAEMEIVNQKDLEKEDMAKSKEKDEKLKKEIEQMMKDLPRQDIKLVNIAVNEAAEGSASGRGAGANISFFSSVNSASMKENERTKTEQKLEQAREERGVDDVPDELKNAAGSGEAYKGPSVISYFLEGRTKISLPVPAYKCRNGGDITVIIEVNRLGYVVNAHVDNAVSSTDDCLQSAAVQAAMLARFSAVETQGNQTGNIVYRFFSQ
ncbi:MAG: hypothetical protein LBG92_12000 [Prevotellaceae bacterium]|jgi:TonB family protein|nr:hypothetical protein [Prevotellaceae bacterium]